MRLVPQKKIMLFDMHGIAWSEDVLETETREGLLETTFGKKLSVWQRRIGGAGGPAETEENAAAGTFFTG